MDMVPEIPEDGCCHGNAWDTRDPIKLGWVSSSNVLIHKQDITISDTDRKIYYRKTVKGCDCKLQYDGQEMLLFNLDNKHLVDYNLLFNYLHCLVENGSPLVTMRRIIFRNVQATSQDAKCIPVHVLRKAWNGFSRLLNIDYTAAFRCDICGDEPNCIICDATSLGVRKDLLSKINFKTFDRSSTLIYGSKHKNRVFIERTKSRQLLGKLCTAGLSQHEMKTLITSLNQEGHETLCQVVNESVSHFTRFPKRASAEYCSLFKELSKNTPVCGMMQIGGDLKGQDIIEKMCPEYDIRQSRNSSDLDYLQGASPVITNFICGFSSQIPQCVFNLLKELVNVVNTSYDILHPTQDKNHIINILS